MLTKTTISAIKILIYLGLYGKSKPVTIRILSKELGASPSYMAKVIALMVKSNILSSFYGPQGGVTFSRSTSAITLLEIIEACQGRVIGDYCEKCENLESVCGFHRVMQELHQSNIKILSSWTLADLVAKPLPDETLHNVEDCLMKIFGELAANTAV